MISPPRNATVTSEIVMIIIPTRFISMVHVYVWGPVQTLQQWIMKRNKGPFVKWWSLFSTVAWPRQASIYVHAFEQHNNCKKHYWYGSFTCVAWYWRWGPCLLKATTRGINQGAFLSHFVDSQQRKFICFSSRQKVVWQGTPGSSDGRWFMDSTFALRIKNSYIWVGDGKCIICVYAKCSYIEHMRWVQCIIINERWHTTL